MKNKSTPNSAFEQFLRKHLGKIEATPGDDLWSKISAKQAPVNKWLKMRRYAYFATALILFVAAAIFFWPNQQQGLNPTDANSGPNQEIMPGSDVPIA